MNKISCEHHSHNFALNLQKLPTKATDRFSRSLLFLFIICGMLLCLLGLFYFLPEILTGSADIEQGLPKVKRSLSDTSLPAIFNALIFLTGIGIIFSCIIKSLSYKKIYFDGDTFTIKYRTLCRKKYTVSEDLYNYLGVRLRVIFYQFGILNKNKFIIELYHEDPQKIVPLYITTQKRGIRNIWQKYARELQMPGITISDKGMVSHNFKDMEQSYPEVVKKWHLPKTFILEHPKPDYIILKSNKNNEKMIKISNIFIDAFSCLGIGLIGILSALLSYSILQHTLLIKDIPLVAVICWDLLLFFTILYILLNLVSKDIIIIANNKIYIFRDLLFTRYASGIIPFGSIKGIDINYTPTSERYYLSIATAYNNYIIGNKMPVDGLRWLRSILIHEIIGN